MYDPILILKSVPIFFALGACSGVIYDSLRFAVNIIPTKKCIAGVLSVIFDVLFMIDSTVVFIISLYYLNSGVFRLIFLLSFVGGFATYKLTLSHLTVKIFSLFVKIILKCIKCFYRPIRFLFRILVAGARKIFGMLAFSVEKIKARLYNKEKQVKNKSVSPLR